MHDPAFFNLGFAYHRTGQLDQAVGTYRLALKLKPDSPDTHFNLASVYADQLDYINAIKQYKETLKYNPGHQEAIL